MVYYIVRKRYERMTKIEELKKLLIQMENITATDEYMEFVGFQTEWDNKIVNAIIDMRDALESEDEEYYIH